MASGVFPMPLQKIPMPFPSRGMHTGRGLTDQPPGTSPDVRNMRLFDVIDDRARGGQRPGTSKEFTNTVANGSIVDELYVAEFVQNSDDNLVVVPQLTDTFDADSTAATWADGDKLSRTTSASPWDEYDDAGTASPVLLADGSAAYEIESIGGELVAYINNTTDRELIVDATEISLVGDYDIFVRTRGYSNTPGLSVLGFADITALGRAADRAWCPALFRAKADRTEFLYWVTNTAYSSTDPSHLLFHKQPGSDTFIQNEAAIVASTDLFPPADFPADYVEEYVQIRGNVISRFFRLSTQTAFTLVAQVTDSTLAGFVGVGVAHENIGSSVAISRFEVGGARVGPYGRRKLITFGFGGGQTWHGENDVDASLSQITLGAGSPPSSPNIQATQLFGRLYIVDGTTGIIVEGRDSGGSGVPLDSDDAVDFQHTSWPAEIAASGVGTLPPFCHGITGYNGRVVLYGDSSDPNNWYMSRVADPLDWDFAADPFPTSAFAADNSDFGANPDPVLAMIPWHNDLMLIGGMRSIRQVTGDPGLGGRIDVVTDAVGMLGFDSWTIGMSGTLYFLAHDGFYRYPIGAGSLPPDANISEGVLNDFLAGVDMGDYQVIVRYDPFASGVYIWITPLDGSESGLHVFYDEQGGGFWPMEYANVDHQCYAAATLRGNNLARQTVLMGCIDGYIRRHDRDALDDDGTTIESYVEYAPIYVQDGTAEGVLRELVMEMGTGDNIGDVTWTLKAAATAQDLDADVLWGSRTGTLLASVGSFKHVIRRSLRFGAAQLRLDHSDAGKTFAIERAYARQKIGGRRRRLV